MAFLCIDYLKEKSINFTYTSFTQGAMVEVLDKKWEGSCDALAHDWLYRKVCAEKIQDVVTYEITHHALPHPVVTSDNDRTNSLEIKKIEESMNRCYLGGGTFQMNIDNDEKIKTKDQAIDNMLKFIKSQPYNYGIIGSSLTITTPKGDTIKSGHAMAYVKRGDCISYFDPNNGEITFNKFSDFEIWFKEEIKNGRLKYLIADPDPKNREKNLANLYSISNSLSTSKIDENDPTQVLWQRKMISVQKEKRESAEAITDYSIGNYKIDFWYSDIYINPENCKKFFDIQCGAILMNKPLEANQYPILKKLLDERKLKYSYVIDDTKAFFVSKEMNGDIKIHEIDIHSMTKLQNILNPNQRILKRNQIADFISTNLRPPVLLSIEQMTKFIAFGKTTTQTSLNLWQKESLYKSYMNLLKLPNPILLNIEQRINLNSNIKDLLHSFITWNNKNKNSFYNTIVNDFIINVLRACRYDDAEKQIIDIYNTFTKRTPISNLHGIDFKLCKSSISAMLSANQYKYKRY